ncbi:MAG: biotin/lipoyl-containing protein [bacterium]
MSNYQFKRDDEIVNVHVEWVGDGYEASIGERSWHVQPVDVEAGEVKWTASSFDVEVSPKKKSPARPRTEPGAGGEIYAPLTGKIIEVLVAEGDKVEPGDVLFKLEAMKLETEIPAEFYGVVSEVLVSAGDNIDEGDKLMIVKGEK